MRVKLLSFMVLVAILLPQISLARDIDLDTIYISRDSPRREKIRSCKIALYRALKARCVDRGVIFAFWENGRNILYVTEHGLSNIIYRYSRKEARRSEICRIEGTVTAARMVPGSRLLFLKLLNVKNGSLPQGSTLCVNTETGIIRTLYRGYPFLDFTLSPDGRSLVRHSVSGIEQYCPDSGKRQKLMPRRIYADILTASNPVIAYLSPNRTRTLIISGSGGSYRSILISGSAVIRINGITSASEVRWLDNSTIAYRSGGPGSYSLVLYDVDRGSRKVLLSNTMNTGMTYSEYAGILCFLSNQLISMHNLRTGSIALTCLEGDDVRFSPDGNRFIALLYGNLFMVKSTAPEKNQIASRRISCSILSLYRDLLNSRIEWRNEFSGQYIRMKAGVYKKLCGQVITHTGP